MNKKRVDINLPEKIKDIFDGKADYRGAYGGRGAAKTIGFANMAILDIMRPSVRPWVFLCGRELQKSLKDSVFSVVKSQIEVLGVQEAFDVGKEFIRCKNGNEFLFYGLRSNIAEVKGLNNVRRTWLEEAQKISQSSLTYLIPTVMRDFPDCELWATWNPDDEDDPIHKMFVHDADETFKVTKINWVDNPWFPESLNKVRLRDLKNNSQRYDWIWNGNFNTNADGSVYGKWMTACEKRGGFVKGLYDPTLPVSSSWDKGFSDDTAIWWTQQVGNEIRWIDYYENNREGVVHYAEQIYGREIIIDEYGNSGKVIKWHFGKELDPIRANYKYKNHFVPHDAVNKLMEAGGRSFVDQMHELGIKTRVVAATTQGNQIDGLRTTIDRSWFDVDRCKDGMRALRKYQYKFDEERNKYLDKPDHDCYSHACDAAEIYGQVWSSSVLSEKKTTPRFLHDATAKDVFWPEKTTNTTHERFY